MVPLLVPQNMNTKEPPYEYCALRFLTHWETKERSLYEVISRPPSADDVRKALHSFQVDREFRGLRAEADKIVKALTIKCRRLNAENVVSRVNGLSDTFKQDFGSRNLSAASKLLWLSRRNPVVILNSRSVASLGALGNKFDSKDYAAYYECWRTEFKKREREIKKAVSKLVSIKMFTAAWYKSPGELRQDISSDWFVERTFDLFLWELGGVERERS